ncbi:5415_t:CDS:2, partial [Gigaspora rosea]
EALKEDEEEYECLRLMMSAVSERIQEKTNRINSLLSHWSEDPEDDGQNLSATDDQDISADDNIVDTTDIENEDDTTQIEHRHRRRRRVRDSTYSVGRSRQNTEIESTTMDISEVQDDSYNNPDPNPATNEEEIETSGSDGDGNVREYQILYEILHELSEPPVIEAIEAVEAEEDTSSSSARTSLQELYKNAMRFEE